jgi:hypothetical protein
MTGWRSRERLSAAHHGEPDMASATQKITLSTSREIPFNKLALSQGVRGGAIVGHGAAAWSCPN